MRLGRMSRLDMSLPWVHWSFSWFSRAVDQFIVTAIKSTTRPQPRWGGQQRGTGPTVPGTVYQVRSKLLSCLSVCCYVPERGVGLHVSYVCLLHNKESLSFSLAVCLSHTHAHTHAHARAHQTHTPTTHPHKHTQTHERTRTHISM